MGNLIGIDVSEHNGKLDWAAIKKAGISFAIIRSGYGTSHTDNYFKANMEGAIAQGLHIGIYHFSYALNATGAANEAEFVKKLIAPYKEHIDMPVFYDFEYDTVDYAKRQGVTLGKTAFNDHSVAFLEAIKKAGYNPGIYYNLDYLRRYVDTSKVGKYVTWYAQYASKASITDYALWQYSSSYTIAGCSGRFDVNTLKDESIIKGNSGSNTNTDTSTTKPCWKKDSYGWWYVYEDGSYPTSKWAQIDGKWYYFNDKGYMLADQWVVSSGGTYYVGSDGAMLTGRVVGLNAEGRLEPIEPYYHLLSEVSSAYRKELDKLIEDGKLKGKSGEGDNLILDLSESALRAIIICNR